jgi:hypothetical protein
MKCFHGSPLPMQFDCGCISKIINENLGNREKNPLRTLIYESMCIVFSLSIVRLSKPSELNTKKVLGQTNIVTNISFSVVLILNYSWIHIVILTRHSFIIVSH